MALALSLALPSAGRSIAARIAMMAITTSNSIRVKPPLIGLSVILMQCQTSYLHALRDPFQTHRRFLLHPSSHGHLPLIPFAPPLQFNLATSRPFPWPLC